MVHLAPFCSCSFSCLRAEIVAIFLSSSIFLLTNSDRATSSWEIISSGVASSIRLLSWMSRALALDLPMEDPSSNRGGSRNQTTSVES